MTASCMISEKEIPVIDQEQKRQMEERAIGLLSIDQMLWHGIMDFERSQVDLDTCKEYWISHEGWSALAGATAPTAFSCWRSNRSLALLRRNSSEISCSSLPD